MLTAIQTMSLIWGAIPLTRVSLLASRYFDNSHWTAAAQAKAAHSVRMLSLLEMCLFQLLSPLTGIWTWESVRGPRMGAGKKEQQTTHALHHCCLRVISSELLLVTLMKSETKNSWIFASTINSQKSCKERTMPEAQATRGGMLGSTETLTNEI